MPDLVFDFAFSTIVFQHIPSRDVIENYVREVQRLLRPGALFKFQVQGDSLSSTDPDDTWLGYLLPTSRPRYGASLRLRTSLPPWGGRSVFLAVVSSSANVFVAYGSPESPTLPGARFSDRARRAAHMPSYARIPRMRSSLLMLLRPLVLFGAVRTALPVWILSVQSRGPHASSLRRAHVELCRDPSSHTFLNWSRLPGLLPGPTRRLTVSASNTNTFRLVIGQTPRKNRGTLRDFP